MIFSNNNIINALIQNKNNKKNLDPFVKIILLFTTQTSLTVILNNEVSVSNNYQNIITDKTTILDVLQILSTIQLNNISFGLTFFFSNEKYITIKTSNVSNQLVNDYKVKYPAEIEKLNILVTSYNLFLIKKIIILNSFLVKYSNGLKQFLKIPYNLQ